VTKQSVGESPYFPKLGRHFVDLKDVKLPALRPTGTVDDTLQITYSDLAAFLECGWAYRLRVKLGFMPRLAAEIGFGKAVHHVLRAVAERTKMTGRVPPSSELDRLLDDEFFLPAANKVVHRELKENARGLIRAYATKFESDLLRVWETERPFELHLDGVVVSGRADVILDRADGKEGAYTLVDYKTAAAHSDAHDLQLRIYADAGRREGLDVREAFVHDLAASGRIAVEVSEASLVDAEQTVNAAAVRLRSREYLPNPERQRCGACDVRTICQHSAAR